MNRYIASLTLLLTALLAGGNALAEGVVVHGSVFGGGNQADVQTNTEVYISTGKVEGNVYGGGNLGDVGTINDKSDPSNYIWKDSEGNANGTDDTKNTGVCNVEITGGTIGLVGENVVNDEDHGNVFGGGKGDDGSFYCEKGMVYSTNVNITKGTVLGDVYGGGQIARVESNTIVTIGPETGDDVADIKGNVFGAGAGLETHGYSALVRGNPVVTIQGKAKVAQDVYGGGKIASVGRHKVKTSNDPLTPGDAPADLPVGLPYTLQNTNSGLCTVDIKGSAEIAGNVFGAGQGLEPVYNSNNPPRRMGMTGWEDPFATEDAYFVFLQTLALSTKTDVTISESATVKGSVYGGSKSGFVQYDTDVKIQGGTIGESNSNGNIYGGGLGVEGSDFAGRVSGDTKITISGGTTFGAVYGGGAYGIVKESVEVNVIGGEVKNDVYGGGALANTNTENWDNNSLTLYHEVSGLTVGTSVVTGLYTESNGEYTEITTANTTAAQDVTYYRLTDTRVNLTGGLVNGDVYGGGLGYNDQNDANDIAAIVYGDVTVTLDGTHMKTGYSTGDNSELNAGRVFGANNVLGTPKGHVKVLVQKTASIDNQDIDVVAVFGGGNHANYEPFNTNDYAEVHIEKGNVNENLIIGTVYGGGNQAGITGGTSVNMISGNVVEGVYGGCNTSGTVTGNTAVMLTGGTVGAGSINGTTGVITYTSKANVHGGGYGHMTYVNGNVDVQIGEMAQTTAGAVIWGDVYGGSAEGHVNAEEPASGTIPIFNTLATTTVSLYNGTINGDAYGGGLGSSNHPAMVGGDVFVKLNGDGPNTRTGKKGAVVNRIFGANNLYGTPKGAVTVNVYATQNRHKETVNDKFVYEDFDFTNISNTSTLKGILSDKITIANALSISDISDQQNVLDNVSATAEQIKTAITAVSAKIAEKDTDSDLAIIKSIRYDVQAVYGGGNLSEYYPTNADSENNNEKTSARTNVMIEGCNLTSINQVYGGGNAASVPGAHVKVDGTYEINEVFGGGNGNDPYQLNDFWYQNPGANIGFHNYTEVTGTQSGTTKNDAIAQTDKSDASTIGGRDTYKYGSGEAKTEIYGGLIHAVYGGSNQRGNIRTTAISIYDDMDDTCPVQVDETYGGGKNAPMDGTIQLNLDCVKNMPMIFGGAKNADINSDITLNITNGSFNKVFGGNNMGGAIYGSITVNVEEKGCQPIYIDELYGGGYFAPYSIYGYEKDAQGNYRYSNGKLIPLESASDNTQPDASRTPSKDPLINIISATQINNVFGGGYEAMMVGSPHVNVNMKAGKIVNVGNDYTAGDKTAKKPDNTDYTYTVTSIETDGDNKNAVLAIGSIGNIYGGGNLADVVGNTYVEIGTGQWINEDGKIETEDADGHKYTYEEKTPGTWKWYDENDQEVVTAPTPARNAATITGDVFGGGQGLANDETSAKVTGNTYINLANGSIAKSIYGGGEQAQIDGNTDITVSGGTIGTNELGGEIYGNIYGGGKGNTSNVLSGLITENTNVTVSDGTILHNIYGGGAYGSVGTYTYDNNNVITGHTANTGTANIWITGGTIGTDGKENGMVFGSSRGDVGEPDGIHDRLAWVYDTKVTIGDTTANATITTTTPLIKGSIYGGGENGHNYNDAYVHIHGGTIGVNNNEDVTYHDDPTDNTLVTYSGKDYNYPYRGNVYGGGCGTDQYDSDDDNIKDSYNPKAGIVLNNARVNITGGHIIRNVYGAGAMGSVGTINGINLHNTYKRETYQISHEEYDGALYDFGLSWPAELVYPISNENTTTGKTTIEITGGTIGVDGDRNGDVYGAARGEAGDRYEMAAFANVRTTQVIIGDENKDNSQLEIKGSVYGGGADGHVYEDAIVIINKGTIDKSVFGGGAGEGTHKVYLWEPDPNDGQSGQNIEIHREKQEQDDVHSWTAGKVYGNTYVTIYDGRVGQNVYGGGNLASVGKGNYTGGSDDYSLVGYGELGEKIIEGNTDHGGPIWTSSSYTDYAYLFLNSGKTEVKIYGGEVGTDNGTDGTLPYGNVFGSSRGKAAKNVGQRSPRYKYVPDFFLGYTNETYVIIGDNSKSTTPIINGSVYGSGQDGHVRRSTNVTINKGTIGIANDENENRGNVFGAGSGLGQHEETGYNTSSGSVTCTTTVTVNGGTIYQNVFGGGAQGSVGPPPGGVIPIETKEATDTKKSFTYTEVNIDGGNIGGNVYGASRGNSSLPAAVYATDVWSSVNVSNGTITGSIFGGGEAGLVRQDATVTMTGGSAKTVYGGGNVADVTGNTQVNIAGGALSGSTIGTVTGAVFGGGFGETTTVTGNVEVNIGTRTETTSGETTTVTYGGNAQITGDVYGGSAKGKVNTSDGTTATANATTNVNLYGGTISGNLYGGGLGEDNDGSENDHPADVFGPVTVTTNGGSATDIFGGNNILGTPKNAITVNIDGTAAPTSPATYAIRNVYGGGNLAAYSAPVGTPNYPNVSVTAGTVGNVFGGGYGSSAAVTGNPTVSISGGTVTTNVYGGGSEAQVNGGTSVTITSDAVVNNNVFGGGDQADVTGSVTVNISGGIVTNDVYGGGALANTNTANWNAAGFEAVSGLTVGESVVTGLYSSQSDAGIISTENAKAVENTTYYQKGTWASNMNDASTGTTYKTLVNLTGGIIGNAYGGGLGDDDHPAYVYGDVKVTVNGVASRANYGRYIDFKDENNVDQHEWVPYTGRIFGANNVNGTPKGNIKVEVYSTKLTEDGATTVDTHTTDKWELHSVYGGGNLANYLPADGKNTEVEINGCEVTSIQYVYGGGNSASVPQTKVTINSCFQIGYVFGGGNGFDPVQDNNNAWVPNPGADVKRIGGVSGSGQILAKGGTIGWIYGGSNKKGICGHIDEQVSQDGDCPLRVTHVYGAGKNADIDGSVNIVIKCPGNDVDYVYGGSLDARIAGDVKMTIIGGQIKNVFGGNDAGGSIGGTIEVNVQETHSCQPVIIENLYGGGNLAAYPNTASNTNPKITVNIKSCTYIGNVYGGGKGDASGTRAIVTGDTEVNINLVKGWWANKSTTLYYRKDLTGTEAEIKAAIEAEIPNITVDVNSINTITKTATCTIKNEIGTIGNVYGGGDAAAINGNAIVNIGTSTTVPIMKHDDNGVPLNAEGQPIYNNETGEPFDDGRSTEIAYDNPDVLGANITSDVFGGGNKADVTGDTYVNISALMTADNSNPTTYTYTKVDHSNTANFEGISIGKSVYGGGCEADVLSNTNVHFSDGYVFNGIFGGGYSGSVGTVTAREAKNYDGTDHVSHTGCVGGKPTAFADGTGKCTIVVNGGQIGPDEVATQGMNRITNGNLDPVPQGWIWGAGCGIVDDPANDPDMDFRTYVKETDVTIGGTAFIMESVIGGGEFGRVLGNTKVTIEGDCQIGAGYNHLENGKPIRYTDDLWKEAAAAVAAGNATRINAIAAQMPECSHFPYGEDTNNDGVADKFDCLPYDPYYEDYPSAPIGTASTEHPSDGKTWIGCVFGGGSGYMPYKSDNDYGWIRSAGLVEGNTEVIITGGHILTNVYGGNEVTNVTGKTTVRMSGGTIGVPRTLDQITAHPVTCYLFGGGKGDQRSYFDELTNVGSVEVEVTGGIIFGSIFGGAEDGHVLGDVAITVTEGTQYSIGSDTYSKPIIGTWGTSYVDGNIFGGGRGFSGENLIAGAVGGKVDITISGGTMLGSIYGGGRLGSVGLDLNTTTTSNNQTVQNTNFGKMKTTGTDGDITIAISGGTIGNDFEFKHLTSSVNTTGLTAEQIAAARKAELKDTYHLPFTDASYDSDKGYYILNHTKGGNVFAGGMGRIYALDGTTPLDNWYDLGKVKSTKLTISGNNTLIKGNVYGGGELGWTSGTHSTTIGSESKNVSTEIIINGGTIGTVIKNNSDTQYTFGSVYGGGYGSAIEKTGATEDNTTINDNPKFKAGRVTGNTKIDMDGGAVKASIYGGGEMASVGLGYYSFGETLASAADAANTYVTVSEGTIGVEGFGGPTMGNVYGGGSGRQDIVRCGLILGNTNVTISQASGKTTKINHNVYGGGAYGTIGNYEYTTDNDPQYDGAVKVYGVQSLHTAGTGVANVTITGGTIGTDGHNNGMVFGSSRGDVTKGSFRDDYMAWVYDTHVTIGTEGQGTTLTTPLIKGSVYGSGENGHTFNDTEVLVHSGTIGIADGNDETDPDDNTKTIKDYDYPYRGNVYGSGCGTDTYTDDNNKKQYKPMAGIVLGNATVTIDGGLVVHNVYGGGSMGSVGTITNFDDLDKKDNNNKYLYKHDATKTDGAFFDFGLSWPYELTYGNTGLASVTITGNAVIGVSGSKGGHVFGAARGAVDAGSDVTTGYIAITEQRFEEAKLANVRKAQVIIGTTEGSSTTTPTIYGSVYGGGEDGHVYDDASVTIHHGRIAHSVFGGGKGEGTYITQLYDPTITSPTLKTYTNTENENGEPAHSWIAGRVYGNTKVTMNGGSIGYNLYGGGNLASVGKGNYSGGYDDYSSVGYGELPESDNSNLWTTSTGFNFNDPTTFTTMADYFMGSGKCEVIINSGTIGTETGVETDEYGRNFPYGNVYGSSRGMAALNVGQLSPRYRYTPDFFLGYSNETVVTIGDGTHTAPQIWGSVYGGGQDGHVRRNATVTINKGTIGKEYSSNDPVIKDRGNVYGAGSGMGLYDTGHKDSNNDKIYAYNNSSGSVTCTTTININGSSSETIIYQNVYGGGAMASVGPPNAGQLFDEYNTTAAYYIPNFPGITSTHTAGVTAHKSVSYTEVNINGGQIGTSTDFGTNNYGGNVYGASRGGDYAEAILKYYEDPNTYTTVLWPTVNVTGGALAGNVFGGGEMGMVKCGINVNITGGTIGNDVYGGGALAHTNTSNWVYNRAGGTQWTSEWTTGTWGTDWQVGMRTENSKNYTTKYYTNVRLLGGTIGSATYGGDVYGGGLGRQGDNPVEAIVFGDVNVYVNGLENAEYTALHTDSKFSSLSFAELNSHDYMLSSSKKGAIAKRIFGANNLNGTPSGHIKVHVFATQNKNTGKKDNIQKKFVRTIDFDDVDYLDNAKGYISTEYLSGTDLETFNSNKTAYNSATGDDAETVKAAALLNMKTIILIAAAKELGISTSGYSSATTDDEKEAALESIKEAIIENSDRFDMQAVYGGGNLAPYIYGYYNGYYQKTDKTIAKTDTKMVETARTEVIIDGCDYSSIKTVYGGGNAAPASGTFVEVNGSYDIYEVFGGGNGADNYQLNDKWYENPGANVGYLNYTHVVKEGETDYSSATHGSGTLDNPYKAIDNTNANTPENRKANYGYGSGIATTNIRGGTIHAVYGGSNKKGNISTTALSVYEEADDNCQIKINETYGGGKDAPMDGEIELTLDCVKNMDMIFGGAKNADVNNNITLNITNGTYKKVFGGNNTSGAINGSITVNIEENGCVPIVIEELYGGGYLAPYSIYGYETVTENGVTSYKTESVPYIDDDNTTKYLLQRIPLKQGETGALTTPHNDPRINIISASRIGNVFGGGYQAKMVGSPHVNINMTEGKIPKQYVNNIENFVGNHTDDDNNILWIGKKIATSSDTGFDEGDGILEIGNIGDVYGGGYLADIVGDTYVEIGTGKWISWDSQGNPIWETEDASGNKYTSSQTADAVTYTQAECNEYNSTNVSGYIASTKVLTDAQATAVNTAIGTSYNANDVIYVEDAAAYNKTLAGFWTTATVKTEAILYTAEDPEVIAGTKQAGEVKTPAVYYTQAECNINNSALDGYIALTSTLDAKKAVAVNEAIGANYAADATIYTEDAAAYNATLYGYRTTADIKTPAAWTWYDANNEQTAAPTPARNAATIKGNVFGGGQGLADNFTCDKAMVGVDGDGVEHPDGGTNVTIANGTIEGSVYGGGKIARVEKNTMVIIGMGDGVDETTTTPTSAPVINGNVFGAGQGVETHGYSALVRGNPTVIIQGNAKVRGSVYGGGEVASVARYKVVNGSPVALANTWSGNCKVVVRGYAEIGPTYQMKMNNTATGKPDNTGHVFGAGKGVLPGVYSYEVGDRPRRMLANNQIKDGMTTVPVENDLNNSWQYFVNDAEYHDFIETLALSSKTDVTITDHAFVKGSVYGGSQNGIVQYNTHVIIEGDCQIGSGDGVNLRYTATEWDYDGSDDAHSLPECAHWDYDKTSGAPYDPFAIYTIAGKEGKYYANTLEGKHLNNEDGKYYFDEDYKLPVYAEGGANIAKDGHTYYGNVFGGGSGVEPYAPGLWHRAAGIVRGNTVVVITGGHILTSVYGGNELTDVGTYSKDSFGELTIPVSGGLCTVNFGGTATLGVPRTLEQIAAHPVTCYLYGAGKGDQRIFFNTWTNVREAEVYITGGKIYGSVFGGGEDGHVLEDITVNISDNAKIGTTGTSYVDGNVFGAGRGFSGDAITAGSVGGNVEVNISGGTMLGSVYGGGRLASVGIGFNASTNSHYGQFTDDVRYTSTDELPDGKQVGDVKEYKHGHVTVNISGGIIGNDLEDKFYVVEVETSDKTVAQVEEAKKTALQTLKNTNKIPYTDFELYDSLLVGTSNTNYKYLYRTAHTKGGNVFGGSMGRLTKVNDSYNELWPQLAQVKTATVNITGGTIKSNVYGGAELGTVRDNTYVTIGGKRNANGTVDESGTPTIYRDVYGGGYGSTINTNDSKATVKSTDGSNEIHFGYSPLMWSGMVGIGTEVNVHGGWIKRSVYGGGEVASVGIINYVLDDTEYETVPASKLVFRKNPNTNKYTVYANIVKHADENNSFALSWPYETHYFPGYEGKVKVKIKGGRIGITGKDFMGPFNAQGKPLDVTTFNNNYNSSTVLDKDNEPGKTKYKEARIDNGDVYGGGKGIAGDRYEMAFCNNVGSTEVTIEYPTTNSATPKNYKKDNDNDGIYDYDCITGSVYAGAENGHVMGNTSLTMKNGLVGHALYGGGKGKGTYTQSITRVDGQGDKTVSIYSITAGKVYGNTSVTMTGGYVVRNVYGGGNMGSVGKGNYAGGTDDYSYYIAANKTYNGYGEALNGALWTTSATEANPDDAWHFLNSGKTEVTVTGGTIGYIKDGDPDDSMKDGLPYGNVFGGCRGESAPNITESPRFLYSPQFFSGYVNETKVTIGTRDQSNEQAGEPNKAPLILGSVYGGGQDGHVRRDANVIVYSGVIGIPYGQDALKVDGKSPITDINNAQWMHRGNVYGAGSGIGKYEYDFNYDDDVYKYTRDPQTGEKVYEKDENDEKIPQESTYHEKKILEADYSTSAGSVTRFTNVEINGGIIHRNVYGGGSLSSVGAPKIPPTRTDDDPYRKGDTQTGHGIGKQTLNEVIINGGIIGDSNGREVGYGGNVYGASRGVESLGSGFATSGWTDVKARNGIVYGNVFGGGEAGAVTKDTHVEIGGKVPGSSSSNNAPVRSVPAPVENVNSNVINVDNSGSIEGNFGGQSNAATEAPQNRTINRTRVTQ